MQAVQHSGIGEQLWYILHDHEDFPRVIDGDNWLRNPPHPEDKPTLFLHIT